MRGIEETARRARSDLVDLTGQKVGAWTVLGIGRLQRYEKSKPQRLWRCRCECGAKVQVRGQALREKTSLECKACGASKAGERSRRVIEDGRSFSGIAAATGLKPDTVMRRYRRGWPLWALGLGPRAGPRGLGKTESVRPAQQVDGRTKTQAKGRRKKR